MIKPSKRYILIVLALFVAITATQVHAAGVVVSGTTKLADGGSSGSPAQWWLDGDFTSPASTFTVGGGGKHWNQLAIGSGQTFVSSSDLVVGPVHSSSNLLDVGANAQVTVNGSLYCGIGSISYYSSNNRINLSGAGSVLSITGNLDISAGYNATGNYLSLSDGATAIVDSDKDGIGSFSLYNHWAYGNCWLELDGGSLFLYGDKTANFAYGNGILSSIKVWDDVSESLQRLAYYESTTWKPTEYLDLLEVAYIANANDAALLGVSEDLVGFTVVQNIPEPATLGLLAIGGLWLRRKK